MMDLKGIKSKGEEKISDGKNIPPTLEEVQAYCKERKNNVDAGAFHDFYESKGWVVGKSPMKNWQAAVRTWERNSSSKKEDSIPSRLPNSPYNY